MRAARSTLIGSHLGGGFSPFAGFPPRELSVVAHRTAPLVHLTLEISSLLRWLACVLVPYRPYVSRPCGLWMMWRSVRAPR
eukprot:1339060-Prymnesium_polylepis.1